VRISVLYTYTIQSDVAHVNAERVPNLLERTGGRHAQEKGRTHTVSPAKHRSSSEFWPNAEGHLDSAGEQGPWYGLSGFSDDRLAREKEQENNRATQLGERLRIYTAGASATSGAVER
jgi:hypothetical protein